MFAVRYWGFNEIDEAYGLGNPGKTKITSNPKDWEVGVSPKLPEEDDDSSMIFFRFKKDPQWKFWVPFSFTQDGSELTFCTNLEICAVEFLQDEDDVDSFIDFLKEEGFTILK